MAIFAGSDQQPLAVYEAARQRGLRIPRDRDLRVVGFDDLPVAQMLGEIIEDRPLRRMRVELSTELIMRESTGPVPGTAR